jgi:hypothetical protein
VLAARFRTRVKAGLRDWLTEIPTTVWKEPWVVDVRAVGTGQAVIKYLAAYVYRTALGPQRILSADQDQVTFQYRDSKDGSWQSLPLSPMEFIRRFLQHVLPKGFQRVRRYGWLSPAATLKWQRILALLDWKTPARKSLPAVQPHCVLCGEPLLWIGTLGRAPPA